MGTTINEGQFNAQDGIYRLVIYTNPNCIKAQEAIPINKLLAEALIKLRPRQRTIQLESCLQRIVSKLPVDCAIKDFDVMFNPEYKIDVIKILIELNKRHPLSVIWPGKCANNCLIYSEEQFADYKVYQINDYDILCVL